MDGIRFAEPFWFAFLGLAALPWIARRRQARLTWPTLAGFRAERSLHGVVGLAWLPDFCRSGAIVCLVIGLARPQSAGEQVRISGRGLTIALVLDRSSSMKTADFPTRAGQPSISRLDAAKQTIEHFLAARDEDLIGVVAFANLPDTIVPPTLDRQFLWEAIQLVQTAGAGDDGTDIGGAIAWGLDLIRRSSAPRKVLILLTDGRHAPGSTQSLDPVVAAEVARGLGITLHTIAIGRPAPPAPGSTGGTGAEPVPDPPGTTAPPDPPVAQTVQDPGPDVDLLEKLAERGNGRAFVATDAGALDAIFAAINALETGSIQGTIRTVYRERSAPWAAATLVLVAVDLALRSGRLRRVP